MIDHPTHPDQSEPPTEPHRIRNVQSPIIPVVADLIKKNPGTISLGQGVVSYGPPPQSLSALTRFWEDPENHKYKPVIGIPPLLEALASKLQRENQLPINSSNAVVVTAGGNLAFMNSVLAITDPGDEVILLTPYYFNHEMAIVMAGCVPVLVPTDSDYQLQVDAIKHAITPRTRAVVTVSPNNPTGAVYKENDLRDVNELCRTRGIYHIHDEAYEYFVYDRAMHFSPGSIPGSSPHTISLFSLSKAYGFASWRIGYMVIPNHLLPAVRKIQDTILICPPVISQYAALGALEAGVAYCRPKVELLASVRTTFLEKLSPLASFCTAPPVTGAFYFLLRLQTSLSPLDLVSRLVQEFRVAAIPGTAFGMNSGCYLRVAYGALQKETVTEGLDRLVCGLQSLIRPNL